MKKNSLSVVLKSLDYIFSLSIYEIELIIEDKIYIIAPPSKVGLSPTLWRIDGCEKCGLCCCGFALVFLPGEKPPDRLKGLIKEKIIYLNSSPKRVYLYRQEHLRNDSACDFMQGIFANNGLCNCKINELKPLHCLLPHLRVFRNNRSNSSVLMRTQFGRNWALAMKFKNSYSLKQFIDDQVILNRLLKISNELGIKTKLPELIETHNSQGLRAPKTVIYV
jgi:Fe-S-cluster containining protein